MAFHPSIGSPILATAAVILVALVVLYLIFHAFAIVGFTPGEVLALIFFAPLLAGWNVPLFERPGLIIAVNLAGFVIPVILVLRFIYLDRLPFVRTVVATGIVSGLAYLLSWTTDEGILVAVYPLVLATVLVTTGITKATAGEAGPVAFTAGAMGTVIGADLVRLPQLEDPTRAEPLIGSIGGAGTLDAIYLVGLLAVLVEIVLVTFAWIAARLRE